MEQWYDIDDIRILYLQIYDFVIQYNWRPPAHHAQTPHSSYYIDEIICWHRSWQSDPLDEISLFHLLMRRERTKGLAMHMHEYNALVQNASHLQNPRWDAESDSTNVTTPPFKGSWRRHNPFQPLDGYD